MSTSIPKLTMFPLYPGGPKVQGGGNLTAYSSFYTQPTDFTPAYGVNVPQTKRNSGDYFTLRSNQTLQRRSVTEANNYSTLLAVDGTILGNLKKAAVPAVAPVIPNLYQDAAELLSISDLKMADLMAQPSFRMNGAGMGFLVTTDGMGGVDTIELSPNSRSANPRLAVTDPTFTTPNMAEITFRATPGSTIGVNPKLEQSIDNRPVQNNNQNPFRALSLQNELALRPQITGLNPSDGIFQTGLSKAGDVQFGKNNQLNPILERLLQLQPQDLGLTTTGFDAAVDAEQSRQVATAQAGYEVGASSQFQENLNSLKQASIQRGDVYKMGIQPQALDGKIPMAPSLPQPARGGSEAGMQFGSANPFSTGSAGVDDTTGKKGSGGYIPFQMNSGSGEMSGGSGQSQPFAYFGMGGGNQAQQQNQQRRRQPMSFVA